MVEGRCVPAAEYSWWLKRPYRTRGLHSPPGSIERGGHQAEGEGFDVVGDDRAPVPTDHRRR